MVSNISWKWLLGLSTGTAVDHSELATSAISHGRGECLPDECDMQAWDDAYRYRARGRPEPVDCLPSVLMRPLFFCTVKYLVAGAIVATLNLAICSTLLMC
jgi:hypothetical protein